VLLFAVAVLAGSGALSLSETLLLGFLGGILGDLISYFLGRHFHQNIRRLPGLRHHPEWMAGAESYFQRYGIASLLVGRFIGPLRPMLPMVAGMCAQADHHRDAGRCGLEPGLSIAGLGHGRGVPPAIA
jgi:undecaprenyl-diphosphatase